MATSSVDVCTATLSYSVHHNRSLKDRVADRLHRRNVTQSVTALRDVTFALRAGDSLALLGHNGAGKSTLLRVLAGIYQLDGGICLTRGRIRSLLDLTVGFDINATGRENIRLRAAVLGCPRSELDRVVSSAAAFSSLGDFLDLPLSAYSTGMAMRLALATIVEFPGDILLMDEVVSVGDRFFMDRAQHRLDELVADSAIVVLATHDLSAARRLCRLGLVLNRGEVVFCGDLENAISAYGMLDPAVGGMT